MTSIISITFLRWPGIAVLFSFFLNCFDLRLLEIGESLDGSFWNIL